MESYETLGVLGEGTYGVVVKARHRTTGQLVAIKKFKQTEDDDHVRKTSLREVRVLKQLHHLNVIPLLEVFRRDGKLFLVFEYLENTILQLLECTNRGLSPQDVRKFMYQLLRGVDYCHAHNIMHRDVKPENILVSREGVLRLCDFGFARHMSSRGKYTDYVATRWYRAPELLVGDVAYGRAVDIWAIGCIFAELSDGQPLFAGDSDLDQLSLILKTIGPITPRMVQIFERNPLYRRVTFPRTSVHRTLTQRYPKQSPEWLELLSVCLRTDPDHRPSCAELMGLPYFINEGFRERYEAELRSLEGTGFGKARQSRVTPHSSPLYTGVTPSPSADKEVSEGQLAGSIPRKGPSSDPTPLVALISQDRLPDIINYHPDQSSPQTVRGSQMDVPLTSLTSTATYGSPGASAYPHLGALWSQYLNGTAKDTLGATPPVPLPSVQHDSTPDVRHRDNITLVHRESVPPVHLDVLPASRDSKPAIKDCSPPALRSHGSLSFLTPPASPLTGSDLMPMKPADRDPTSRTPPLDIEELVGRAKEEILQCSEALSDEPFTSPDTLPLSFESPEQPGLTGATLTQLIGIPVGDGGNLQPAPPQLLPEYPSAAVHKNAKYTPLGGDDRHVPNAPLAVHQPLHNLTNTNTNTTRATNTNTSHHHCSNTGCSNAHVGLANSFRGGGTMNNNTVGQRHPLYCQQQMPSQVPTNTVSGMGFFSLSTRGTRLQPKNSVLNTNSVRQNRVKKTVLSTLHNPGENSSSNDARTGGLHSKQQQQQLPHHTTRTVNEKTFEGTGTVSRFMASQGTTNANKASCSTYRSPFNSTNQTLTIQNLVQHTNAESLQQTNSSSNSFWDTLRGTHLQQSPRQPLVGRGTSFAAGNNSYMNSKKSRDAGVSGPGPSGDGLRPDDNLRFSPNKLKEEGLPKQPHVAHRGNAEEKLMSSTAEAAIGHRSLPSLA